jgi:tRNA(adenine34) deaminase
MTATDNDADVGFMAAALADARLAPAHGDVPVGAVVVVDGDVIARDHNRREQLGDPTAHAELLALRSAARHLGHWRVEATLYVTQEPCPMCAGALVNARVVRLVYGCTNPKAGAIASLFQLATDHRLNHQIVIESGVCADECARLLKEFFAALRRGPGYR